MAARSQNGFLYVPLRSASKKIAHVTIQTASRVNGTFGKFTGLYLHGRHNAVANAMGYLVHTLDGIEAIDLAGWDGGYADRLTRGSTQISCHASGTAHDHNATAHPMGGNAYAGWTPAQIREIHSFLDTKYGAFFTWGAHFTGRKDPMHFQITSMTEFRRHGYDLYRDGKFKYPSITVR